MKTLIFAAACIFFFNLPLSASDCAERARVVPPVLSEAARSDFEAKLREARIAHEKAPSADTLIWVGRRTAYLGNYKEAVHIFTEGIQKYPADMRFYRHRGHRLITLRCFDDAISDLSSTLRFIMGKPDQVEPDGLPNARNIPTSTLHTNIFYHLGLAYYLKGDFNAATQAFMNCFNIAKNDDMKVAAAHWVYMSAARHGPSLHESAKKLIIREFRGELDIIENDDYYKLLRLYQGKTKPGDLLKEIGEDKDTLSSASLGYGLGNWFLYNGGKENALKIFRRITGGNQWSSFGFIAAEADLKRF